MSKFSQCLNSSGRLRGVNKLRVSVNHLQGPIGLGKGVQQAQPVFLLSRKFHDDFMVLG
jgi:hypothetical protein